MSLEKAAKKILKNGDDLTVVMLITVDKENQTSLTAAVRDPTPEAKLLIAQLGRFLTGPQPPKAVNKLPI
ncbi:MAG: hypothetical protein KAV87_17450 [Desulfobacteraceae bacterium]|nr:hypothetical protein [Desulfobacteraceae bacterium]